MRIGDIVEIDTPRGLAYLQYTHKTDGIGEIVRVLPGFHSRRPDDFTELAKQRELYFIFYSLGHALRAGQTEIVSNQPVPKEAAGAPVMRHPSGTYRDGRISGWRIVFALAPLTPEFLNRTPVVRDLTPEQQRLSIRVLRSHQAMVKELAREWTPERSAELEEKDRARAQASKANRQQAASGEAMRHFLYFRAKANADKAAQWFRTQGYLVETRLSGDGENWLTLVKHPTPANADDMSKVREEMEALASRLEGEYDGWESAV